MTMVVLASAVSAEIMNTYLQRPIIDLILNSEKISADNILGWLLVNYQFEILGMVILSAILMIISVIAFLNISRITQKISFFESIRLSILDWKKSIELTFLFWIVFVILIGVIWVVNLIGKISTLFETILILFLTIIIFIMTVKLIFTIPVLTKKDLRKSLQESWRFTENKFWTVVFFIIITIIVSVVIALAIIQIGIALGGPFELILSVISEIVSTTYFFVAITDFYYFK